MSYLEQDRLNNIFQDYQIVFSRETVLHPFRSEVGNLEQQGYKIAKMANLFSLFYGITNQDPDGQALLKKLHQIPLVEIIHAAKDNAPKLIAVFLRNMSNYKAIITLGLNKPIQVNNSQVQVEDSDKLTIRCPQFFIAKDRLSLDQNTSVLIEALRETESRIDNHQPVVSIITAVENEWNNSLEFEFTADLLFSEKGPFPEFDKTITRR